ncbi:MAG: hypothetical protein OEY14_01235, partial [Myxococcales bacterium]|nr:hypothetical protein [Myxococcales bacterium]
SVGSGLPAWDADAPLPSIEELGLEAMLSRAGETLGTVGVAAENLRSATDPLADQELTNDLKRTARNLARITQMLAEENGTLQRLATDPSSAEALEATLQSLRRTSDELAGAARGARAIVEEIRAGDGTAHELIYGASGAQAVRELGGAANEIAALLREVREGEGTAHDLIYEDSAEALLGNLTEASRDIAAITAEIRAGRGTLGGLLTDPSIYEDIKRLVGDLERNEILRALVRYSIRRDEASEDIDVQEQGEP